MQQDWEEVLKIHISHEFKWLQSTQLNDYVPQSMPTQEGREKAEPWGKPNISMDFKVGVKLRIKL